MISVEELSSKIKNDSNAIIDYIIKSFTEMNNELSMKDEIIKQKEQELINHKNIIEQLRIQQVKSLQSIEDLVMDLKELRKNYEELQKYSESYGIVIIYNPAEILEYPEGIINQYSDKVDLQHLTVEQIFNFINQFVEKGNYRALDNIIKRAIDLKLTVLSEKQFNDLTKLLEKYIDSELKENRYPGEVVYYFIKKMNSLRWTELLKDFILRNIDNIETIIFSSQRNQQRDQLILEVLKTYFLLNQFDVTRKFIEDILNNNLISEFESLEDKDLMEMLFIATYLGNDLLVFDYALKYAGGIDHVKWPERDCYMTYYDVIEKRENISSYINKFKVYSSICKNINFDIKEKVISKMIITLENMNKQDQ